MDDSLEDLKLRINNLIWMHGHERLTLIEAEERAAEIHYKILEPPTSTVTKILKDTNNKQS